MQGACHWGFVTRCHVLSADVSLKSFSIEASSLKVISILRRSMTFLAVLIACSTLYSFKPSEPPQVNDGMCFSGAHLPKILQNAPTTVAVLKAVCIAVLLWSPINKPQKTRAPLINLRSLAL